MPAMAIRGGNEPAENRQQKDSTCKVGRHGEISYLMGVDELPTVLGNRSVFTRDSSEGRFKPIVRQTSIPDKENPGEARVGEIPM